MTLERDEERVLVLAPSMHDAPITARLLLEHRLDCVVVPDVAALCAAIDAGAGAALIAEEALDVPAVRRISEALERQEPWSDLPVILFMTRDRSVPARLRSLEALAPLGNVTVVDRPAQVVTVVSAVRAALRGRRRQYAARAALLARRRVEEDYREQAVELEAILDAIGDGVVVYDRDGRTVRSNPAADAILGVPLEVRGAPVAERIAAQYDIRTEDGRPVAPTELVAYRAAVLGERIVGAVNRVQRHGGEVRWLALTAIPLVISGEHKGAVLSMTDITDRKVAAEALREADRRKDDFLSMLSHELRNPLTPIRTSAHILRRAAPGGDEAVRAQRIIERQAEHLTRLVDDLLDVTRITRGKIEVRRAPIDLRDVLIRAAEDLRLMMEERGIAFRVEVPQAELRVEADAARLTQVIGNLLHNAAKFTPRGGEVALFGAQVDGAAEIHVRDTGAGVEPALLPTIFDAFVQGKRTLARTEGGLGLGLALVKGITELHGGTVRVESGGPGSGSEFVVRLPLSAAATQGAAHHAGTAGASAAGRRVLVVDDNRDAAESLADILRLRGHLVDVAYDGKSAVERVRASAPDVVLCDIGLPGMSGYDVARALRAAGAKGMQLIAVSGYAQPEDVKRALDAGFNGHVAKPCDPERICQLLG